MYLCIQNTSRLKVKSLNYCFPSIAKSTISLHKFIIQYKVTDLLILHFYLPCLICLASFALIDNFIFISK